MAGTGIEVAKRLAITLLIGVMLLVMALFAIQALNSDGPVDTSSISHQDGNPPPTCRPASKYAGDPHPNEAECKHKVEKHNKP